MSSPTQTRPSNEARLLDEASGAVESALALGADNAAASVNEGRSTEYVLRDGKVEKVQESVGKSLAIEIYADGRYSMHSSNDLRPESLRDFLSEAVALTRVLEPDPHRQLPDPALYAGRSDIDLDLVDDELDRVDRDATLEYLREMDAACHADERVLSAASTIQRSQSASGSATSNGFAGAASSSALAWVAEVTVDDEDARRPEAYAYAYARHLEDLPAPGGIARLALERALSRLGSAKAASTTTTMVVDREAAGSLLGRVFGALSAGAIQQKRSFLADRLGEPVASEALDVRDEPLLPRGLASCLFDGEGIASKSRAVIESGTLRTYFVDTYYGRKLGWKPTACSPSNLLVTPGTKTLEQLLAEVGEGIYVTAWAGGNADATTGDFSFGLRGHEIRGGAIGAAVSEMNVTGNYLELLQRLRAVGNDPFPYAALRIPTLVFDDVQFSGG